MIAAATGSSVAPGCDMSRYIDGCSGILTSAEQPASSKTPIMAVVARFTERIPQRIRKRLDAAVVAYQPWLNGERGVDLVPPHRCHRPPCAQLRTGADDP